MESINIKSEEKLIEEKTKIPPSKNSQSPEKNYAEIQIQKMPVVKIKIEPEDSDFMYPVDDTHRMASINIKSEEKLLEGNSETSLSNNAQSPGKNDTETQMQKRPVVKIERETEEAKTRLFIGNLPRGLKLEELKSLSPDIVDVCLPESRIKEKKIFTGFAFLQFDSEEKAMENYLLLKEKEINGKLIRVEFAEKPRDKKCDMNVKTAQDMKCNMTVKTEPEENCNMHVNTGQNGECNMNVKTGQDRKSNLNIKAIPNKKCNMNVKTSQDGNCNVNVETEQNEKYNMNVKTNQDEKCYMNIKAGQDEKYNTNVKTFRGVKCNMNIKAVPDKMHNMNVKTGQDGKCNMNVKAGQDKKYNMNVETEQNEKCNMNVKTKQDEKCNMNVKTGQDEKYNTNIKTFQGVESNINVKPDQKDKWNMKKLIVRDLDNNVTIDEIAQFFPRAIDVHLNTGHTFKTALVEYNNIEHAARDLDFARASKINGKPISVAYDNMNAKTDQEDKWNMKKLIVHGLDSNVTIDEVVQFLPRAIDVDIRTGDTFKTAFAEYNNIQDAARDLDLARSSKINGKPISVTYDNLNVKTDQEEEKWNMKKLIVRGLDRNVTMDEIAQFFPRATDVNFYTGRTFKTAFVEYRNIVAAARDLDFARSSKINGIPIPVTYLSIRKRKRLRNKGSPGKRARFTMNQGSN